MKLCRWIATLVLAGAATPAVAGPPYLTDDPVPTDLGHWEIYSFTAGEGHRSELDADAGLDLNYGAAARAMWSSALSIEFVHKEKGGFSVAVFPRAILPTTTNARGERI